MNIAEILTNAPTGTKLYSTVFGDVELLCVDNSRFPIKVRTIPGGIYQYFTTEGKINTEYSKTECLLFPSKENRDWSTFKVEKSYEFKPFDKVLVRNDNNEPWSIQFFGYYDIFAENKQHYVCLGNSMFIANTFKQCIPFEGYENLIGTTTSPDSIYPA